MIRSQTLYPIELWVQIIKRITPLDYKNGGSEWNRTIDTGIFSPLLYRLSYRAIWRSRRGLNPRSSAWQADVLTTALRDQLVAGIGFEPMTFGLWARRATELLHPAISKMAEEKGFEPLRRLHDLPVFKTGPFNQLGYSSIWCLRSDLNRHEGWISQDFKSCASTYSATQAQNISTFSSDFLIIT